MKRYIILVFLSVLALTSGCSTFECKKKGTEQAPSQSNILQVDKGKSFKISLAGNPTTGYIWELPTYDKSIVKLINTKYKTDKHKKNMVGVGGKRDFEFKAFASGTAQLNFIQHRPWEKGKKPIKTVTYKIEVL